MNNAALKRLEADLWRSADTLRANSDLKASETELGRDQLARTKVLMPLSNLQAAFSMNVAPLWASKRLLARQITVLETARGALLPRLIFGKLPVDALDIRFPPAMEVATHEV